jgi:hypothetical protein
MFKHYLVSALRILTRQRGYSALNLSGLAVGLAVCMLILLWVQDELSFDRFHHRRDEIYRVISDSQYWEGFWGTPAPLAPAISEAIPHVEGVSRIATVPRKVFRSGDRAFYEDQGLLVDPAFLEMFTFPFVQGDPNKALKHPHDIVITEAMADKYFSGTSPIGSTIDIEGKNVTVTGVVKNIPHNSHLQFDFLVPFQFIDQYAGWGLSWGSFNFGTYILLRKGTDPQSIGPDITREVQLRTDRRFQIYLRIIPDCLLHSSGGVHQLHQSYHGAFRGEIERDRDAQNGRSQSS